MIEYEGPMTWPGCRAALVRAPLPRFKLCDDCPCEVVCDSDKACAEKSLQDAQGERT